MAIYDLHIDANLCLSPRFECSTRVWMFLSSSHVIDCKWATRCVFGWYHIHILNFRWLEFPIITTAKIQYNEKWVGFSLCTAWVPLSPIFFYDILVFSTKLKQIGSWRKLLYDWKVHLYYEQQAVLKQSKTRVKCYRCSNGVVWKRIRCEYVLIYFYCFSWVVFSAHIVHIMDSIIYFHRIHCHSAVASEAVHSLNGPLSSSLLFLLLWLLHFTATRVKIVEFIYLSNYCGCDAFGKNSHILRLHITWWSLSGQLRKWHPISMA